MSEHRPGVRNEADVMRSRGIVVVTIAVVVVTLLGIFWAWGLWRGHPDPPLAGPAQLAPREIGYVDQSLFAADRSRERGTADKRRLLESWRWVDRERGVVRMPVGEAMDLVVEQPR